MQCRIGNKLHNNINDITTNDIHIADIALSLSRQRRYLGYGKFPWTVGQHELLILSLCMAYDRLSDNYRVGIFLHDLGEFITQDIITPIKSILNSEYKEFEDQIKNLIYNKFDQSELLVDKNFINICKRFDNMALLIESMNLFEDYDASDILDNDPDLKMLFETLMSVQHIADNSIFLKILNMTDDQVYIELQILMSHLVSDEESTNV